MPGVNIADWMQDPQSIAGIGGFGDAPAPVPTNTAALVGKVILVGAAAGALWALFGKKK